MTPRKPDRAEQIYLDFDGFFASVEQQARPALRGKPVGVIPFDTTDHTCVIACSKEAKKRGVKNVMPIRDAKQKCPELVLVPQSPDLYRRAHNTLINEISCVLPIEAIKSIDELTCRLDQRDRRDPLIITKAIKERIRDHVGPHITCSIGVAANRQLAKIACKMDKPDGITIWRPEDMPAPLLKVPFDDVPGIGKRMQRRLFRANIATMQKLLATSPKQMRQLWRGVTGERLWYALHGFDVKAQPSERRMIGHSRVLPPESRSLTNAKVCARLLLTKAARRLRREGFYATKLWLHLAMRPESTGGKVSFPASCDDQACLKALNQVWENVTKPLPKNSRTIRVGVALYELQRANARQTDLFADDDKIRQKWESVTTAMDHLNEKYGQTVISIGTWKPPAGGYAGGKIAYTRVPAAEDFW